MKCLFVTDLHGHRNKYDALLKKIRLSLPRCVFIGGDILPLKDPEDFLQSFFFPELKKIKKELQENYPHIITVPGNDDPAVFDSLFLEADKEGIIMFIPEKTVSVDGFSITGYPFVPPTPFLLKDREKYDVSRFVDPGCIPPDEGRRTVKAGYDTEFSNIAADLKKLYAGLDPSHSIFLFHSPPYNSSLDRAALDGQTFDHVPLDVHVGSIAIQRFIEEFQPLLTLHGHIHESYRLTGQWKEKYNNTTSMSAVTDTNRLAVITFDTEDLTNTEREEID